MMPSTYCGVCKTSFIGIAPLEGVGFTFEVALGMPFWLMALSTEKVETRTPDPSAKAVMIRAITILLFNLSNILHFNLAITDIVI